MKEKFKAKIKEKVSFWYELMTTIASVVFVVVMVLALGYRIFFYKELKTLPKPEVSEGMRGELGIDKNVNESTIDEYLNRPDAVYRDMRMFKDDAKYEAIGGDSYLSGVVDGFEVVPMPYLYTPTGLPEAVGKGYTGKTLFKANADGTFTANYKESNKIMEDLFPKDKVIFLMCGGGGYAGMTKKLLVALGWDENKIYNVGGYWYYGGSNRTEIKDADGNYAFWKAKYHVIDFSLLHEAK